MSASDSIVMGVVRFRFGASFSVKYARDLGLDWRQVLTEALDDIGIRRFRLMSHWDLIEPQPGQYDFGDLDWQMDQVAARDGEVSITIGLRQPHHPECHQPAWAKQLPERERQAALARVIETTVLRYRNHPALDSWQLENEALNNQFGECVDFDGNRLAAELELVKQLDPSRLVVMSLKNHHTFSTRGPRPDIYATSIYLIMHRHNRYARSWLPPWYQRLRSLHIRQVLRRPFFIHELQAEPWGPAGTQDLSRQEQDRSMNPARFRHAINYARRTGIEPVDLWGLEWWYYRRARFGDEAMWQAAKALFKN